MCLAAIACLAPNSNRIGTALHKQCENSPWTRGFLGGAAAAALLLLVVVINTARDSISAFIYFNF